MGAKAPTTGLLPRPDHHSSHITYRSSPISRPLSVPMPFGPGLLVSTACLGSYFYWRFSFRAVPAALELERSGRLDEARVLLHRFLESHNPLTRRGESRSRCRLLLARLERKAGRYDDAVRATDVLLKSGASDGIRVAALQVRADALSWAGEQDQALDTAAEALDLARQRKLSSFVPEIQGLLARIYTWRGDLDRARSLAQDLIEVKGAPAWYGYLRLSEIERVEGNYPAAAERCRQLLGRTESDPAGRDTRLAPVFRSLAHLYATRAAWLAGDLSLAEEWLSTPPTHSQTHTPTHSNTPDALPRSDHVPWYGLVAVVAAERGDRAGADRALREMDSVAEKAPPGLGVKVWRIYYRARVQMVRGDYAAAAEGLTSAIRNSPPGDSTPELFYTLGRILEAQGSPGAQGAFACGARQPQSFYFARLCSQATETGALQQAAEI